MSASLIAIARAKRLGLLHDVLPAAKTIGLLINPTNHIVSENYLKDTQTAARTLGLQIIVVPASSEHEIDNGFRTMAEQRIDALMISPDAFLLGRQDQIRCARRAPCYPDDVPSARERGGRWTQNYSAILRTHIVSWHLHRPNPQGGKASRHPGCAGNQV